MEFVCEMGEIFHQANFSGHSMPFNAELDMSYDLHKLFISCSVRWKGSLEGEHASSVANLNMVVPALTDIIKFTSCLKLPCPTSPCQ